MGVDIFPSNSTLLMVWLFSLLFTGFSALVFGLFATRIERLRAGLFALMILPGFIVTLAFGIRGFEIFDRPVVHWVFEKSAPGALHLGLVFDSITFAVSLIFGLAAVAICFRNKPTVKTSSALAISWLSICLAASSQTIWLGTLAIGIQLLSKIFPLTETKGALGEDDARWTSTTQRSWIGLSILLVGAAGLAVSGVHLDFFSDTTWGTLTGTPSGIMAGGFLILGLLIIATPVFTSRSPQCDGKNLEENIAISESSMAWSAVIVLYRLIGHIREPEWLLAIGAGAALATVGSLAVLPFQTKKGNAIYLWLSTFPVSILMVLPFLPTREAFLYLLGAIISFNGLWISLDHRKTKIEIAAATVFLLGGFGFFGWTSSSGLAVFFSSIESDPFFRGPVFLFLLIFMALGWRLALRGGEKEVEQGKNFRVHGKWIVLGILFLIGFGPLLSGRWSGGALPGEIDWIEGAKAWPWIKTGTLDAGDAEWMGFGISQALVLFSALLGIFSWRAASLFPFAEKYPRGARAAEGFFGLSWLCGAGFHLLRAAGKLGIDGVSEKIWERGIPALVKRIISGFRKTGEAVERIVDPVTGSGYGRILIPASKLVQWFHGGNVRLYAWFTLAWVLIFSIYLTR